MLQAIGRHLCVSQIVLHTTMREFFFLSFFLREGAFASSIFLSEPVNGVVFRKRRLLFVVVPPLPSIFLSASGNNNHTYRRGKVFHSLFFLLLLLLQNCLGDAHLAAVAISPSALFLSFFNCPLPGASFSTTVWLRTPLPFPAAPYLFRLWLFFFVFFSLLSVSLFKRPSVIDCVVLDRYQRARAHVHPVDVIGLGGSSPSSSSSHSTGPPFRPRPPNKAGCNTPDTGVRH